MDPFWKGPLRVIQNNLRGNDAENMNVEELMRTQSQYGTNVIIANAGGLMCWYDSQIYHQPKNPYLKFDYVKEVIHYAKKHGMKVLLRLDVSNLSEKDLGEHPDWLRRNSDGEAVYDLGAPQSCILSPMWQEYNFRLIDELMEKYHPDGLFYNAVHYGFCHCDRCKAYYKKVTGAPLPDRLLVNTEEGRRYMRFRYNEMSRYLSKVREAIHRHNPDAVLAPVGNLFTENPYFNSLSGWDAYQICQAEDIQVSETVTAVTRHQPYWTYLPGENAAGTAAIGKPAMLCIHQMGQLGRNAVAAPAQYTFDIAQAALHGGSPAINMIGTFQQEDKKGLAPLKKVFHFLKDNAGYLTDFRTKARVALVYSQKTNDFDWLEDQTAFSPSGLYQLPTPTGPGDEYRGIYEALVHQHIPFDPIHDGFLDKMDLSKYQILILPGVSCLSGPQRDVVDRFVAGGGGLVVTGTPPLRDGEGRWTGPQLKCLPFEVQPENANQPSGGYLMLGRPELYPSLPGTGLIGIGFGFTQMKPKNIPSLVWDMRRREPPKNNKPEFSNIADLTDEYGMFLYPHEKGQVLVLPWALGQLYRRYGIYECPRVLKDLIRSMGLEPEIETSAPHTVETIWATSAAGETLSLVNSTGISGKPMVDFISLHQLDFSLRTTATQVFSRATGQELFAKREGGTLRFTLPRLDSYDILVLK